MPNHITSQVEISGTKELIAKLIKDTKIKLDGDVDSNEFDFNGIVKMPPELRNTASPTQVLETQEGVDAENKRHEMSWKNGQVSAITKVEADRRKDAYGALNWYDWSIAHWGTKWNAYEVRYIAHTDTTLVLELQTAWGTPDVIWNTLEERGYTVKGVIFGEMDGFDYIGDGADVFEAYQNVEIEYVG